MFEPIQIGDGDVTMVINREEVIFIGEDINVTMDELLYGEQSIKPLDERLSEIVFNLPFDETEERVIDLLNQVTYAIDDIFIFVGDLDGVPKEFISLRDNYRPLMRYAYNAQRLLSMILYIIVSVDRSKINLVKRVEIPELDTLRVNVENLINIFNEKWGEI